MATVTIKLKAGDTASVFSDAEIRTGNGVIEVRYPEPDFVFHPSMIVRGWPTADIAYYEIKEQ
jgi:hypothetical protein